MVKRPRVKCDSCGKSFSQARILKKHIDTVHNGLKDHKCDSCGKAFSDAQYLKTHMNSVQHINRVHNGLTNSIQGIIDKCMSNYTPDKIQNQMGQIQTNQEKENLIPSSASTLDRQKGLVDPLRSNSPILKNPYNIEVFLKKEISEENEISEKDTNIEMILKTEEQEMGFEIHDHNNPIITNNEIDPINTNNDQFDYSKNILPKSVTYVDKEDEKFVNEFKPFPCGFCYDIYTDEKELSKHVETVHQEEI